MIKARRPQLRALAGTIRQGEALYHIYIIKWHYARDLGYVTIVLP